jgi:hypothetical protein
MITKKKLHELFEYKDGDLYWKVSRTNSIKVGQKVGTKCDNYLKVSINKVPYRLHRLIFLMHHGYMPEYVDHIDGNTFNNRIENLRQCTMQENNRNQKLKPNNTSGYKNVTWSKSAKKWQVGFMINNNYKHIGTFADLELADLVAQEARNKYFGQFARHK